MHFAIARFVVDGAKLLTANDFDVVVAPYVGKDKDFTDVQKALGAVEGLYAEKGYSAVHVTIPEQKLNEGPYIFR